MLSKAALLFLAVCSFLSADVVFNNVLIQEATTPELSSILSLTRRSADDGRVAYFGFDTQKNQPVVWVKKPGDSKLQPVTNVPSCSLQYMFGEYARKNFSANNNELILHCGTDDSTPGLTGNQSSWTTSADWKSFAQVLAKGPGFKYSNPAAGFTGNGTVQQIYGVWPNNLSILKVEDSGKVNSGIFELTSSGWQQVATIPSSTFVYPDSVACKTDEGYYYRGVESSGTVVYKITKANQQTVVYKNGTSILGESTTEPNLVITGDGQCQLQYSPTGSTKLKRMVNLVNMEKVLHPSTFNGIFPFQTTIDPNFNKGMYTAPSTRAGDFRPVDLVFCLYGSCSNILSQENIPSLVPERLGNSSVLYNNGTTLGLEFSEASTTGGVYKLGKTFRAVWPIVDPTQIGQIDDKIILNGYNFVLYPNDDRSAPAYTTEVIIGGQRLKPESISADGTTLTVKRPAGMKGNVAIQVEITGHPAGVIKSFEARTELSTLAPHITFTSVPVTVNANESFKICYTTEGDVSSLYVDDVPLDYNGCYETAMFQTRTFNFRGEGIGGSFEESVRVVVNLSKPVIESVSGTFSPSGEIVISGKELWAPELIVRVVVTEGDQNGQEFELGKVDAGPERIVATLPGDLTPGTYVLVVTKSDGEAPIAYSNPWEIHVTEATQASSAESHKGGVKK